MHKVSKYNFCQKCQRRDEEITTTNGLWNIFQHFIWSSESNDVMETLLTKVQTKNGEKKIDRPCFERAATCLSLRFVLPAVTSNKTFSNFPLRQFTWGTVVVIKGNRLRKLWISKTYWNFKIDQTTNSKAFKDFKALKNFKASNAFNLSFNY